MLANWVKETTATTGTVTTIALGGAVDAQHLPFSSQIKSGEVVPYIIEDGNNAEEGVGTVTTGTPWTITRTLVLATKVGSVYTDRPALGINLSGTATVAINVGKNMFTPAAVTQINGATGANYVVDAYLDSSNLTTQGMSNNNLWLIPFYMHSPVLLSGLGCSISTLATTGTVLQLGIYDLNPNTNLASLVAQTATINALGVTGVNNASFAANLALPAGMYLIGVDGNCNAVLNGQSGFYTSGHPFMPCSYNFRVDGGISALGFGSTYVSGTMPTTYQLEHNSMQYGNQSWPRLHGVQV